jgi:hypothetical protein
VPSTPLDIIRRWTGSIPDDLTLLVALESEPDPLKVALQVLHVRYSDMVANPAKWAVVDDYSQDTESNLAALASQIRRLEGEVDGTGAVNDYPWGSVPIEGPSLRR